LFLYASWPYHEKVAFTVTFKPLPVAKLLSYDLFGRKVYETELPAGTGSSIVNCSNWPPGIYLVRLQSFGVTVAKANIIKQY